MTDNKLTNNVAAPSSLPLKPSPFIGCLVLSLFTLGFGPQAIADSAILPDPARNQTSIQHADNSPARLASYHSTLQNHEAEGPYHQNSSEVLYSLGLELQKGGQHGKALKALRRSMHINRVNSGLNSLSQAPMLRSIINSQKNLMRLEPVTISYQQLLRMQMARYGKQDPRLAPLLNELALWHIDAYPFDDRGKQVDHLTSANSLNAAALKLKSAQTAPEPREQISLLRSAALISFHLSRHAGDEWSASTDSHYSLSADGFATTNPQRTGILTGASFRRGLICHQRIVALTAAIPDATLQEKLQAETELADWYLIFNRRKEAMVHYQQVLAQVAASEHAEALHAKLFSTPRLLPAMRMENDKGSSGRLLMTASVDISEKGGGSNIENISEVLLSGPSPTTKNSLHYLMIDTIKGSRFRPQFIDNKPAYVSDVRVEIPLIH